MNRNKHTLGASKDLVLLSFFKRTANLGIELRIRHTLGQIIIGLDVLLDGLAAVRNKFESAAASKARQQVGGRPDSWSPTEDHNKKYVYLEPVRSLS